MSESAVSTVIDLHSHSTASDGALTPSQLFAEAAKRGVGTLALTDHDTLAGLDEAQAAADKHGVELVPGLEITCECAGTEIHLLGLGVDRSNSVLRALCDDVQGRRRVRFFEMIDKLRAHGVPLSTTGVEDGVSLARPYLARMLVQQGYVGSYNEAFERYLRHGCPGFVAHTNIGIQRAIDAIHAAGGVAVMAHPGLYRNGDECVFAAVQVGLDGIEVWHSDHSHDVTAHYLSIARKLNLLATGGADFHAPDHPRARHFGKRGCPPEEYERLTEALRTGSHIR